MVKRDTTERLRLSASAVEQALPGFLCRYGEFPCIVSDRVTEDHRTIPVACLAALRVVTSPALNEYPGVDT